MANTRIQIKRSINTQAIPALYTGELCYSQNGSGTSTSNGGLLYIGRPSDNAATAVGGVLTFGLLTANQIISTNSASGLNQVITANLVLTGNSTVNSQIIANNGLAGSAGQILASGGTTGNIYWATAGGGGTVTSIGEGNGIASTQNPLTTTGTLSVNLASTPGLNFSSGGLEVFCGNGAIVNSSGVCANLAAVPGLGFTSGGLNVVGANGISITAAGVNIIANNGLVSNSSGAFINPDYQSALQLMFGGI